MTTAYTITVKADGLYVVDASGKPVHGPFTKREQALFIVDRLIAAR